MIVSLDARDIQAAYADAFQKLVALTGFSPKEVLRAEAGVILKTWAGKTKVGTQARADIQARRAVAKAWGVNGRGGLGTHKRDHPITVNSGMRGPYGRIFILKKDGRGYRRTHDAGFVPLNQHYTAQQWSELNEVSQGVQADVARKTPLVRSSMGLARQSVIQIADKLGIDLSNVQGGGALSDQGIAKALASIAANGTAYNNGTGYQDGDDRKFYIDLINTLPYGTKIGMDQTLLRILSGRIGYLENNYRRGLFDSIRGVTRAYPNLFKENLT